MPDVCCAVGCSNRRRKGASKSFYTIPKKKILRERWVKAINRDDWKEEQINNARLCGDHFITGKRSADNEHPDYVPSIFAHSNPSLSDNEKKIEEFETSVKRRKENLEHDVADVREIIVETAQEKAKKQLEIMGNEVILLKKKLKSTITKLDKNSKQLKTMRGRLLNNMLDYKSLKKNSKKLRFYTGITLEIFNFIYSEMKRLYTIKEKHLLIVFIKLRLGLYNRDLAYRMRSSESTISKILRLWIPRLSKLLAYNIVWPTKRACYYSLPKCFKKFRRCVSIIDCTEVFIERPQNTNARSQTWSNYKNNNTSKFLIGIAPNGAVNFVSPGWGGRVSDREITMKTGFLDKLEPSDVVLADRGFNIEFELASRGATLKIPSFTKGKKQLTKQDVDRSRQLANVRIHVERVIGRLRKFNILNKTVPISQVSLLDDMMICVCGLVNMCESVIPK